MKDAQISLQTERQQQMYAKHVKSEKLQLEYTGPMNEAKPEQTTTEHTAEDVAKPPGEFTKAPFRDDTSEEEDQTETVEEIAKEQVSDMANTNKLPKTKDPVEKKAETEPVAPGVQAKVVTAIQAKLEAV